MPARSCDKVLLGRGDRFSKIQDINDKDLQFFNNLFKMFNCIKLFCRILLRLAFEFELDRKFQL